MSAGYVPPRPDVHGNVHPSSWTPPMGPVPSPSWRRATFARVVLHVVIGAVMWFGLLIAMLVGVLVAGRTPEQFDAASQRSQEILGGAVWLLLLAAEAGWLFFVFLRTSRAVRLLTLIGIFGVALVIAVALGLSAIPRSG